MAEKLFEPVVIRDDQLTVSKLVWRRHRAFVPGAVEEILNANPGLADSGPFMPAGVTIMVPALEQAAEASATPAPSIKLW